MTSLDLGLSAPHAVPILVTAAASGVAEISFGLRPQLISATPEKKKGQGFTQIGAKG